MLSGPTSTFSDFEFAELFCAFPSLVMLDILYMEERWSLVRWGAADTSHATQRLPRTVG